MTATYTELFVQHFRNSSPNCASLPVPLHLQHTVASILILHNPRFPRHFLNGAFIILHSHLSGISFEDETAIALYICSNHAFRCNLLPHPQTLCRLLCWPQPPNSIALELPGASRATLEGSSYTMFVEPGKLYRLFARLSSYTTLFLEDCYMVDGAQKFRQKFPAKAALADSEHTIAISCPKATNAHIGYIQYTLPVDETLESATDVLITDIEVDEKYRRCGFAQALIFALIANASQCCKFWIHVDGNNMPALSLYRRCGFVVLQQRWVSWLRSVPGPNSLRDVDKAPPH